MIDKSLQLFFFISYQFAFGIYNLCHYFLFVNIFKRNRIFKLSAQALILASTLCVLFGNGVHLHSMLDHIFDHGDVHVVLHAHSHSDQKADNSHASNDADKEHEVSTIDLSGILSHSKKITIQVESISDLFATITNTEFGFSLDNLTLLDLPPPDITYSQNVYLFFSLRAPPIA